MCRISYEAGIDGPEFEVESICQGRSMLRGRYTALVDFFVEEVSINKAVLHDNCSMQSKYNHSNNVIYPYLR